VLLEVILFLLVMVAGTCGELAMARAMRAVGEVKDFRPAALLRVAGQVVRVPWSWIGLGLMTLAFFALLEVLSIENVSFVVPVTALSYAFGTLGGRIFLREEVSAVRWAGVLLVCIGVTLVVAGKR
jgi:drug/metabolite transporter (DMT)-like permease